MPPGMPTCPACSAGMVESAIHKGSVIGGLLLMVMAWPLSAILIGLPLGLWGLSFVRSTAVWKCPACSHYIARHSPRHDAMWRAIAAVYVLLCLIPLACLAMARQAP